MSHPTVLIVACQPSAARDLVSQWQAERSVPSFTLLSTEFPRIEGLGSFDLAILQSEKEEEARQWQQSVEMMAEAVIYLGPRASLLDGNKTICISQSGEWLNKTILLGAEILRRSELARRLRKLEGAMHCTERQASLGQYMLDARHGFNNALTSVLGNAELLMIDTGKYSAGMREQIETIHAMALKLYEMMQRFSSLEAETRFDEKSNARELPRTKRAAYGS